LLCGYAFLPNSFFSPSSLCFYFCSCSILLFTKVHFFCFCKTYSLHIVWFPHSWPSGRASYSWSRAWCRLYLHPRFFFYSSLPLSQMSLPIVQLSPNLLRYASDLMVLGLGVSFVSLAGRVLSLRSIYLTPNSNPAQLGSQPQWKSVLSTIPRYSILQLLHLSNC